MKKIFLLALFFTTFFRANAQFNTLLNFTDSVTGGNPTGSLISDGTFLYGTTAWGGVNDSGVVFKIMPDGTGYVKLLDFNGANGARPNGDLFYDGTFLYGMTSMGGVNDSGVVFKIMPNGTGYSKLLDFGGVAVGSSPSGSLISDGTYLYGMTQWGGTNNFGIVFKIKPDGTGFSKLLDFVGTNGNKPQGALFYDGTFLYGMTTQGGTQNRGVIFQMLPNGTGYSKLKDFGGASGNNPSGSLISDGTYLYGMTQFGGASSDGVLFKIQTNGTGFSKLIDFNVASNGGFPLGSLLYDGTYLYGMTYGGGLENVGTLFKILPNGNSYSKLYDFVVDTNGFRPTGSLFYDGTYLYGTTFFGGSDYRGTIFRFKESPAGINDNEQENNFTFFPNPSNGKFFLNSKIANGEISICNLLGEIVYQSQITNANSEIDLTDESNGIYFVMVKTETQSFTQKIIVSH